MGIFTMLFGKTKGQDKEQALERVPSLHGRWSLRHSMEMQTEPMVVDSILIFYSVYIHSSTKMSVESGKDRTNWSILS